MGLYNNQSAPTTATIKFNNLVTSGMVAVLHTNMANVQDDIKAVSQGDMSKVTGMAQVARGTSKVDIEDAIDSVDDEYADPLIGGGDLYVPLFLPADTAEYTAVYPGAAGLGDPNEAMMDIPDEVDVTTPLLNTQKATFFNLASNVSKKAVNTGAGIVVTLNDGTVTLNIPAGGDMNLLEVYDQYGDELWASEAFDDYEQDLTDVPFELKKVSSLPTTKDKLYIVLGQFGTDPAQEYGNGFTGFIVTGNPTADPTTAGAAIGSVANSTWEAKTPQSLLSLMQMRR